MERSSLGQLLLVGVPGLEIDSETADFSARCSLEVIFSLVVISALPLSFVS